MQQKLKFHKPSRKVKNSQRSEDKRGGGTGWECQNNDNMGKEEMEKKKEVTATQTNLLWNNII